MRIQIVISERIWPICESLWQNDTKIGVDNRPLMIRLDIMQCIHSNSISWKVQKIAPIKVFMFSIRACLVLHDLGDQLRGIETYL